MSKHSALNTFGRSGNPAFTRNFDNTGAVPQSEKMTLDGAVNKTAILLSLCFGGAFIGWNVPALAMPGLIIGTILAFVTIFRNPAKAGTTAPFYAGFEGIALLYLVSFIMSFFGSGIGFIHSNGMFGIGFSLFVVGIAALNLVLDFDFIEEGAEQGLPKYMEWYGAFSLMVTLVWLYIEILRLLMKLRSR